MSCRSCGKKFTSLIDAVQHMNLGCEDGGACVINDEGIKKITPSRFNCPLCGEAFSDTSVFARLNHKCPPIPEPEPEPEQISVMKVGKPPKTPKEAKVRNECQYCHKQFIKIDRHYENCKKKDTPQKKSLEIKRIEYDDEIKEEPKETIDTQSTPTPQMWHCDVCNTDMKYYQQFKHIETKTHLSNKSKLN